MVRRKTKGARVVDLAEPILQKIASQFPLEEVAPVSIPQDNGVGPADLHADDPAKQKQELTRLNTCFRRLGLSYSQRLLTY
ncbi:hypothetical protein V5799_027312 [Amblyomma americanum]|uniref:Uncharacterized protein n=1 Tax=Amblyomma americanum TaxID=6943 RepID=A0AAQ4DG33_AMBAM